jgi:hypothetical protein
MEKNLRLYPAAPDVTNANSSKRLLFLSLKELVYPADIPEVLEILCTASTSNTYDP